MKKRVFLEKFRINSGVLRVARGDSGAKAPGLAARPDGSDRAHAYATIFTERTRTQQQSTAARHVLDEGSVIKLSRGECCQANQTIGRVGRGVSFPFVCRADSCSFHDTPPFAPSS